MFSFHFLSFRFFLVFKKLGFSAYFRVHFSFYSLNSIRFSGCVHFFKCHFAVNSWIIRLQDCRNNRIRKVRLFLCFSLEFLSFFIFIFFLLLLLVLATTVAFQLLFHFKPLLSFFFNFTIFHFYFRISFFFLFASPSERK